MGIFSLSVIFFSIYILYCCVVCVLALAGFYELLLDFELLLEATLSTRACSGWRVVVVVVTNLIIKVNRLCDILTNTTNKENIS